MTITRKKLEFFIKEWLNYNETKIKKLSYIELKNTLKNLQVLY